MKLSIFMSSYVRLKHQYANQLSRDVQVLIEENELYRRSHAFLKSCQNIAEVEDVSMLAGKIRELKNESTLLHNLLNTDDRTAIYEMLQTYKYQQNSGIE